MDIDALKAELTDDPESRGYSGMTDAQAAVDLNTEYRARDKTVVSNSEALNSIDKAEFNALDAATQARVWNVIHIPEPNPFGLEADLMLDAFGSESATITALKVLRVESISRAVELKLGVVKVGHVQMARL